MYQSVSLRSMEYGDGFFSIGAYSEAADAYKKYEENLNVEGAAPSTAHSPVLKTNPHNDLVSLSFCK